MAKHLAHGRGQVFLAATCVDLLDQPWSTSGCAQQLECPRELRGGGLVSGEHDRHQVVAHLARRHRRAVGAAAPQARYRVCRRRCPGVLRFIDDRVDQLVDSRSARARKRVQILRPGPWRSSGSGKAELAVTERTCSAADRAARRGVCPRARPRTPTDRSQDGLERQRAQAWMQAKGMSSWR